MDASRLRLGSAADWSVAAIFLVATVGVAGLIVHELTSITTPTSATPDAVGAPSVVPSALPSLSIPVSVLPLPDGEQLRLGDGFEKVSRVLGRRAETGVQTVERGRMGQRVTRGYQVGTLRFMLVLEPFERNGELRIAGIYVQ